MPQRVQWCICAALLCGVALAGCEGGGPVKGAAKLTGFATDTPESKDFVKATRPDELEYIPVGSKVDRPTAKMTPAQFKEIEADLDARRVSNEQEGARTKAAGATPPPAPIRLPQ